MLLRWGIWIQLVDTNVRVGALWQDIMLQVVDVNGGGRGIMLWKWGIMLQVLDTNAGGGALCFTGGICVLDDESYEQIQDSGG